eukprot:10582370-Alexandrium_andersonii.AAC.1
MSPTLPRAHSRDPCAPSAGWDLAQRSATYRVCMLGALPESLLGLTHVVHVAALAPRAPVGISRNT